MVSSIAEIALKLATQNPDLSTEEISETIISTIESEPVISDIVLHVQVPDKIQIRHAKLKSKRLPKKKRAKKEEQIDNANLLGRLKYIYTVCSQRKWD